MSKIDVFYICDRKACANCSPECFHTTDISHAKNFTKDTYKTKIKGKVKEIDVGYFEEELKTDETQAKIDFDDKMRKIRFEVSEEFRDEMKKEFNPEACHFSLEYIFQTLDEKCEVIKKGEKHE